MFPFRFIRAWESAACPFSAPILLPVTFSSFRNITGHSRLSQSLSTVPACQVSGLAAEELSYSSLKSNGILIFPQSQQALPRNQYLTCGEADRDEMEGLGMIRLSPTNQECFKDGKQDTIREGRAPQRRGQAKSMQKTIREQEEGEETRVLTMKPS